MKNRDIYKTQTRHTILYFVPTINCMFVSFYFAFADVSLNNTLIMFLITSITMVPLYFPVNYLLQPTLVICEDEIQIKKLWGGVVSFNCKDAEVVIIDHAIKFKDEDKSYILRNFFSDSDWNDICQRFDVLQTLK